MDGDIESLQETIVEKLLDQVDRTFRIALLRIFFDMGFKAV